MNNLWTVAEFTIKDMIKRKSFIISMIVILVFIVIGFNVPRIMKMIQGENSWNTKVLIIDEENIFESNTQYLDNMQLEYDFEVEKDKLSQEEIKAKIEDGEIDSCVRFKTENGKISMEYIVESAASDFGQIPQDLVNAFVSIYSNIQISKLNLNEEQLKSITPEFDVKLIETDERAAKRKCCNMYANICSIILCNIFLCRTSISINYNREDVKDNGNTYYFNKA